MKKLALAVLLGCAASSSYADDVKLGHFGTVFGEFYQASEPRSEDVYWRQMDDAMALGLEYGYRFDKNWALRLEWARQKFDLNNSNDSESGNRYGVDALFHFNDSPFYALVGVKTMDAIHDANAVNVGLGLQKALNEQLMVSTEAALYQGYSEDFQDIGVKLGLTYYFDQGTTAAPAPTQAPQPAAAPQPEPVVAKPVDTDGDGVTDDADQCPDTAKSDAVDEVGCAKFVEQSRTVTLAVNFDNNSSVVKPEYFSKIQEVADFMKHYGNTDVVIEGHTSAQGSDSYNQMLSEKRAQAVAKILVETYGIDASRVSSAGYGESRLKNPANTAEAHKENRRIEAVIKAVERVKVAR